jgi:hypothetical protein
MVRLLGSQNYTLSRIWDAITINNAPSNTGAQTFSKPWDDWCSRQPMASISFTPLGVDLTVKRHWYACIPKYTLQTDNSRNRYRDILKDNDEPMGV